MITEQQVTQFIGSPSTDELQQLVCARLIGKDARPVGDGYTDEPPEDLAIVLLKSESLTAERRAAVLGACKAVAGQLLNWLALSQDPWTDARHCDALVRWCNVVDATGPDPLKRHSDALLDLVLERDAPARVLGAVVRAAAAFVRRGESHKVPVWEHVLNQREVAAYGFRGLLEIDPYDVRVPKALADLWIRWARDDWPVDVPFLMRRAMKLADAFEWMPREIALELQLNLLDDRDAERLRKKIAKELERRSWSQAWSRDFDDVTASLEFHVLADFRTSKCSPALNTASPGPLEDPSKLAASLKCLVPFLMDIDHRVRSGHGVDEHGWSRVTTRLLARLRDRCDSS